jgi:phosphoesterase RecJ-like protein
MSAEVKKLKELIESSNNILITTHISPDPDALSSVILFGATLKQSFPDKNVAMVAEEEPVNLNFISGYEQIIFAPLLSTLQDHLPDLFIILDGNNYERASRHDGPKVRELLKLNHIKTVIIDHHEPDGKDEADLYINHNSPATVQDVYALLFHGLGLKKPNEAEQIAIVGLYADSGGFAYVKDGQQQQLFDFVKELVGNGANVEKVKNLLSRYSEDDIRVLSMLLDNVSGQSQFTYSFLGDEFIDEWHRSGKSYAQLQPGTGAFLDDFVRNIDGRLWGFIVYKNILQGERMFSVSFRAVSGAKDVSKIAASLGGGGHKPAAGAKFEADSITDAIDKVKAAIENSPDS